MPKGRFIGIAAVLLLALVAIGALALLRGTPALSPQQLTDLLLMGGGERVTRVVVLDLRLPRLVLGALCGALLGLSGTVLQDTLRNPLAGPELLGVTAGASVVAAVLTIFRLPVPWAFVPWLTLCGGLVGGGVVLLVARTVRNPVHLVLIGASVTALLNAVVIALISLATQSDINLLFLFLLGSLANRTWQHVQIVLPWALVGIPCGLLSARLLNVLQLGDEVAAGLGLAVGRIRVLLLVLGAGLVTAVVAVCGPIGWVALLAPHLARRLLQTPNATLVLPVAALLGAVLLAGADVLARLALAPAELPVGIWTTLLGGPLLLLLMRAQISGRND